MTTKLLPAVLLLLAFSYLVCCSPGEQAPEPAPEPPAPEADAGTGTMTVGSLSFDPPSSWTQEPTTSSMRLAQFALPGEHASCVLFFFGVGGGGGVEMNMERWISQVTQPDGSPSSEVAKRSVDEHDGLRVHKLDLSGTWSGGMSDSGGGEDWRFLGAVVEGPGGPYFFRVTGPEEVIAACLEDYERMLASMRPAS